MIPTTVLLPRGSLHTRSPLSAPVSGKFQGPIPRVLIRQDNIIPPACLLTVHTPQRMSMLVTHNIAAARTVVTAPLAIRRTLHLEHHRLSKILTTPVHQWHLRILTAQWPPPMQGPPPPNTRKQWSQPPHDNHPPHGPQHYPRDRESRQHSRRERERREYERSRERDLDHGGYGYRDGRPGSRSGPSEKKEKDKKKKTSGKTMAGTLASIGGLAALLEGLDGAF